MMTEKEKELISEVVNEEANVKKIEDAIKSKKEKLAECKQKIIDLNLAIKEEQLESIRESIAKNGYDFEAFREALEKGQLQTLSTKNIKNTHEDTSEKITDEEKGN